LKYRKEKNARIAELERLNEEATSNVETLKKIEQDLRNRLDEVQKEAEDGHLHAQLEAQVREVSRLEDLLADEEDNNEKLKEKIRIMRRGGADDGDRVRFEEKVLEAELLRVRVAEREELVRLAETRVAEKNRTILYLKNYLRTHGFRVEDDTVGELKTESELKTSVTDSGYYHPIRIDFFLLTTPRPLSIAGL
jgi:predicted RNase H-like nuclease (RuvC/YqgF family)